MKIRTLFMSHLVIFIFFANTALGAPELSIRSSDDNKYVAGEYVNLEIVVNDATGLAGCAFNINYDKDVLIPPTEFISSIFNFTYTDTTTVTKRL